MIGVIGLGFVGLTTSLGFSEKGITTMGYDIDRAKINLIKSGKIPFHEPGLKKALDRNLDKKFTIVDDIKVLIDLSEIIFVCVGTPRYVDGSSDLSQIRSVFDTVSQGIKESTDKIILIKSTVPPGTTDSMLEYVNARRIDYEHKIEIGMNPEFLREGHAWEDFMNPDRIVVGINCGDFCRQKIADIYKNFGKEVIFTNTRTAEFLKYLSNTLLSTLISYSNEMSLIAKKIGGVDIEKAFKLLHLDKRFFGDPANIVSYVYPGCGYGGYCLPKDTEAIARMSLSLGLKPEILEGNLSVNLKIMNFLIRDFMQQYRDKSTKIGILGLAFKPDSDDVRETPALKCIKSLLEEGYYDITAFDPMAMVNFARANPELKISYVDSASKVIEDSQAIFILTAWKEFSGLNFKNKAVYNLRYIPINNESH